MISSPEFDQKFAVFAGLMAVFCLFGALYFFAESGSEPIFILFGLVLVIAAMVMLWGAQDTMKRAKRNKRTEQKARDSDTGSTTSNEIDHVEIIGVWHFEKADWVNAMKQLHVKNSRSEIVVSLGIFLVSAIAVLLGAEAGFLIAGVFAALLYFVIRTRMSKKIFRIVGDRSEVIFSKSYIQINQKFMHFNDGFYRLRDIETKKHPVHHLLIVIDWPTGKGFRNSMDLRIPIPAEQEESLEYLTNQLQQLKQNNATKPTIL